MPTVAGTTEKKPRRNRKKEAEAERYLQEKLALQEWVEDMRRRGAKVLLVWGRSGRRKVQHRIVVYKGTLLFPDHGKASIKELLAEDDLRSTVVKDACVGMANYHLHGHAGGLPTGRSTRWRSRDKMTQSTAEWWSEDALRHIEEISEKRTQRATRQRPISDPVYNAVPFGQSIRARINPIYRRITGEMEAKLGRVVKKVERKGVEQRYPW